MTVDTFETELDRVIREASQQITEAQETISVAEDVRRKAETLRQGRQQEQEELLRIQQSLFGRAAPDTLAPKRPVGKKPGRGRPPKGDVSIPDAVKTILANGPQPLSSICEQVFAMGIRSDSPNPNKVIDQSLRKMRKAGLVRLDRNSHLYHLVHRKKLLP